MLKAEKWKSAYLEALNTNFSLMILNLKVYKQTVILT